MSVSIYRDFMKLRIPPALIAFVVAGLMWIIDLIIADQLLIFAGNQWIAAGLLGVGVLVGSLGLIAFYNHSTSINPHKPNKARNLVTKGIYQFSRNPMYLGLLLILAAWGFYLGSLVSLLMLLGFIDYMNRYQIFPEEQVLTEKFGKAYLKYKKRVKRWL